MAAMTYIDMPDTEVRAGRGSYLLDSGSTYFQGGLMALDSADGKMKPLADVATMIFLGFLLDFENSGTGVTDAADPSNPEGRVNENGDELLDVAIAGSPGEGVEVYCGTDNWRTDITTVATTNTKPIGWITRITGAGRGNVRLYTPQEYVIHP